MNTTNLQSVIPGWNQVTQAICDQGITRLQRYVQQESVSCGKPRPIPDSIWQMVRLVEEDLRQLGPSVEVKVHETAAYPVVTATVRADNAPSLLLYNMGDTRPLGDEKEWLVPPLSCETVEVEGQRRIIGRGAFNSKSGLAGMIDVIELLLKQGSLPVNLEVIIDFEEEVRVTGVTEVLIEHRELFAGCQAAFMPLCIEDFDIYLGAKGVAVARVTLEEERSQCHSGKESVLSPSELLGGLADFLGAIKCDSEALKDNLPANQSLRLLCGEVSEADKKLAKVLAKNLTTADFAAQMGVERHELRSGYVDDVILGQASSHINILSWRSEQCEGRVPSKAYADIEFRIAPSIKLSAGTIEMVIRRYLQSVAELTLPIGVTLTSVEFVAGTGRGFCGAEPESFLVKALQRSYAQFDVERGLSPCLWASCPEGAEIVSQLGIPFLFGGLGKGGNAHVPNEYLLEGSYQRFKEWLVVFLHELSK